MRRVFMALVALALCCFAGCTLFGGSTITPGAASPSGPDTQEIARTLVMTLTDAWNLTGQMCVDVSQAEGVDGGGQALRDNCKAVLMPALDELHAAALLVDAWDSASQQNFGCALVNVVSAIDSAWKGAGQEEPVLVSDVLMQAHNFFSGSCADAGVPADGGAG